MHKRYDIGDKGQIELQKGIIEGAKAIANLPVSEFAGLKSDIDKQVCK